MVPVPAGSPLHSPIDPRRALVRVTASVVFGVVAYLVAAPRLAGLVPALVGLGHREPGPSRHVVGSSAPPTRTRRRSARARRTPGARWSTSSWCSPPRSACWPRPPSCATPTPSAPALAHAVVGLCLATVALAWTMTHTAFAFRYARLYYRADSEGIGGVELPGQGAARATSTSPTSPSPSACASRSPTSASRSRQIRRAVLLHAVISFAYNSVILAFVLNLVFGMAALDCARGRAAARRPLRRPRHARRRGAGADVRRRRQARRAARRHQALRRARRDLVEGRGARRARGARAAVALPPEAAALRRPLRGGRRALPRHGEESRARAWPRCASAARRWARRTCVRLLRDASEVLDYLHGRSPPVIHRDLKPGNVLRRPDGSLRLRRLRRGARQAAARGRVDRGRYVRVHGARAVPGARAAGVRRLRARARRRWRCSPGKEPEELPHRGLAIDVRAALRGPGQRSRWWAVLETDARSRSRPARGAHRAPPGSLPRRDPRRASVGRATTPRERHDDRFERRQARRAARRAERAARWQARRNAAPALPVLASSSPSSSWWRCWGSPSPRRSWSPSSSPCFRCSSRAGPFFPASPRCAGRAIARSTPWIACGEAPRTTLHAESPRLRVDHGEAAERARVDVPEEAETERDDSEHRAKR